MWRVAVFIDGLNVLFRLQECGWAEFYDVRYLAERLARKRRLAGTYYYYPAPSQKQLGTARYWVERNYLDKVERQSGIEPPRYGYMQEHAVTQTRSYWNEKKVDVWLGSEMVYLASIDAYDTAVLVSADNDLVPAIEFVQKLGRKVELVIFEKAKPNIGHLLAACDWAVKAKKSYFKPY